MKSVVRRFIVPVAVVICLAISGSQTAFSRPDCKTKAASRPKDGLTLKGVVTYDDPADSRAVIENSRDHRQKTYRQGDIVAGMEVIEISRTGVHLAKKDGAVFLSLDTDHPALGDQIDSSPDGKIICNFNDVDIRAAIRYFSDLTGKNFIVDDDVRGSITIIGPTAIPIEDAMKVLESILEMKGYVLVPSDDFIKIMSKKSAARRAAPVLQIGKDYEPAGDDVIVTRIINLTYLNAGRTIRDLKRNRVTGSTVIEVPATNSLIIRDTSSNVDRLEALIKALDKPPMVINGVKDLIMRYSKLTGKNIILGKIGKNRVQVFNAHGLSDGELVDSMEAILLTAGLKMEERGDLIVIEPDPEKAAAVVQPEPGDPPAPKRTSYKPKTHRRTGSSS